MSDALQFGDCRIKEVRIPVETSEAGVEPIITVVIEMPPSARGEIKPLLKIQGQKVTMTIHPVA